MRALKLSTRTGVNAALTSRRTRVWSGGSVCAIPTAKFSWSAARSVSQPGIRSMTRVTRSALEKRRVSRTVVSMSSARVSSQHPHGSTQWTGDSSRKRRKIGYGSVMNAGDAIRSSRVSVTAATSGSLAVAVTRGRQLESHAAEEPLADVEQVFELLDGRGFRRVRAQHDGHHLVAHVDGDDTEPLARRGTPGLVAGAEDGDVGADEAATGCER